MKKIVLLSFLAFPFVFGETVTDTAQRLKFFDFMRNLRAKTSEFLGTIENERKAEILMFKGQQMNNLAEEKEEEWLQEFNYLTNEIDRRFEAVDHIIVVEGANLNERNSTEEEKEALVDRAHKQAIALIDGFIRDYRNPFKYIQR